MTHLLIAALLFLLALPAGAAMPGHVTVRLFESHQASTKLIVEGPFNILYPGCRAVPPGKYEFECVGRTLSLRSLSKTHPIKLNAQKFVISDGAANGAGADVGAGAGASAYAGAYAGAGRGVRLQYSTSKERRYAGKLEIGRDAHGLYAINIVPVRDYVMSVVGSESNQSFNVECLKAQAILTQTRVATMRQGAISGDSTQEESYFGMDYISPAVRQAVGAVWGQVLTFKNQPIHIFYHSTCAGGTSDGFSVFGEGARSMPYLKCVPCQFCQDSPFWKATITSVTSSAFSEAFGDLPEINSVDCANRPTAITLRKEGRRFDQSGYRFWIKFGQRFGWDKAPGLRFKMMRSDSNIRIESTGAGHGVGMCQWGAAGMAKEGKTCAQILNYYFPGTKVRAPVR